MIPFLGPLDPFPPVEMAREDMGGLLAVGGGLLPDRLLDAYRQGIFPWGTVDGLPLWYSPDPRMVLFPDEFRLTRSLNKTLRSGKYAVRFDTNFAGVMDGCATTPRIGQDGTWISPVMKDAYVRLHELGWAHSVETYEGDMLVGGLYGLAIGRMFYGESMFSHRTDHLASLGGREIPRDAFLTRLTALTAAGSSRALWASSSVVCHGPA